MTPPHSPSRGLESPTWRRWIVVYFLFAAASLVGSAGCRCFQYDRDGAVSPAVAECRRCSHLAIAALERGDYEQAEQLSRAAVKASGGDAAARRHLAEALWKRGKLDAALVEIKAAQAIAPHDCDLLVTLSEIELAADHWEAARHAAEAAIDADPRSPRAWILRGDTFRRAGRLDDATADYARALGLSPDDPHATRRLALVSLARGEPERAVAYSEALIESYGPVAPVDALDLHGEILARLGRGQEAAAVRAQATAQRLIESPRTLR